jgi:hypothetical protein
MPPIKLTALILALIPALAAQPGRFSRDLQLSGPTVAGSDYTHSGFSRAHMGTRSRRLCGPATAGIRTCKTSVIHRLGFSDEWLTGRIVSASSSPANARRSPPDGQPAVFHELPQEIGADASRVRVCEKAPRSSRSVGTTSGIWHCHFMLPGAARLSFTALPLPAAGVAPVARTTA